MVAREDELATARREFPKAVREEMNYDSEEEMGRVSEREEY